MLIAGSFLQNRYEIISRIGSGGMADVYKAKDHKLNRNVAVKVLKQEFKDDKAFISKFRIEAQAAAGLAHTNIVNVYDVGEENGINFIVMELVEGITLKVYIQKKGYLPFREATSIALQVAVGLEAAHNNGIIHRDVKPQNILISVDGKAKIADFGIARAVSSDTISSNVMGSVHYSSPEQSRGGYSDAKSDIYSMGITLFEMVTGKLPFDGENSVAIALKHLQEEMPSPRKMGVDIPLSTEQIILKCTQKSPNLRYSNMTELIRDLKESLANPDGSFVTIASPDPKAHTVWLSKEEVNQIKNGSLPFYDENINTGAAGSFVDKGNVGGEYRAYPNGGNYYQSSGYQDLTFNREHPDNRYTGMDYVQSQQSEKYMERMNYPAEEDYDLPDDYDDDEDYEEYEKKSYQKYRRKQIEERRHQKMERIITVTCIVAAVIAGLVLLALIGSGLGIIKIGRSGKTGEGGGSQVQENVVTTTLVTVPNLVGKSEEAVRSELKEIGLGSKYQGEESSSDYPKGTVIFQSIEAGTSVEENTTVGYRISSGYTQTITVPNLAGVTQEDAVHALENMGMNVYIDNSRYSETVEAGYVITTNPGAGSNVTADETITIYVSQGTEASVTVPQLAGHYEEDAKTALNNLGLYVCTIEEFNPDVEKGMVISQDVAPGSNVGSGTTVTLRVSKGSGEPDIVINPQGRWMCYAQLNAPDGYRGEPVRITLVQNGVATTIFEGTTSFPFILNVEGQPGVAMGEVYVYTLDPVSWEVTSTTSYQGVVFSQVDA